MQKNQSLPYCIFTFHLFIVNTGKREGRGAKIKMHTDVFRDSQAEWLLVLSYASYTGNKKEGSIILASMLWSQNTDTFILLFVFTFVFICS